MAIEEVKEYLVHCDHCDRIVGVFDNYDKIFSNKQMMFITGYKWVMGDKGHKAAAFGRWFFCNEACKQAYLKNKNAEEM